MPVSTRTFRVSAVALGLAALTSCSKDGPTAPTIAGASFAASLGVNLAASTKTASGLYYRDVTVGTGATAVSGLHVSITYAGYLANGTRFDPVTGTSSPLGFSLGAGQVIPGFDEGVTGMRVGGTRQIIIPPALGYGASAQGAIPANSILVFMVTLVSVP